MIVTSVVRQAQRHPPLRSNRLQLLALGRGIRRAGAATTLRASWTLFSSSELMALVISSLIGIVVGDSAVHAAMHRLGPRRTAVLYATNAPFAAVLGFLVLGETLAASKVIGIALVVVWRQRLAVATFRRPA